VAPNTATSRVEQFGEHILGEYVESRTPPPDRWWVFTDASGDKPDYVVVGFSSRAKLDSFVKGTDRKWDSLVYYFDTDCDGVIDLIGYQDVGSKTIDRYQRPESSIRLNALARQLAKALDDGTIIARYGSADDECRVAGVP
jgi:hypothetical protein